MVACNSRGHRHLIMVRMCCVVLLGVAEACVHLSTARLGVGPETDVRCAAAPGVVAVEEPEETLMQRGADEAEAEGFQDGQ